MTLSDTPTLVTSLLRVDGVEVRGALTIHGDDLRFSPTRAMESSDAELLRRLELGCVVWGEAGLRYEQPVRIEPGLSVKEFILDRIGPPRRMQLRASERRIATLPATALLDEPRGFVLRRGRTIDLSTGGVSFMFDRDPDLDGPPPPPESGLFGVVIDLPEMRVAAIGEVVSAITTGVRSGVRARFDRMHGVDADAVGRFVSRTELMGYDPLSAPARHTLERPAHTAVAVEPGVATDFSMVVTVDELASIPTKIIDDRATSAWLQIEMMRDVTGRPLLEKVDLSQHKPVIAYEHGGLWMLGTVNQLVSNELHLRLVAA